MAGAGTFFERHEKAVLVALVAVFIALTVPTLTRTPTIFCDEAPYTDPAANLYWGRGFTSTMWAQPPEDFWCGNVPLYQLLLFGSFKVLGFGLFQARVVNLALSAAGAALLWGAVRRSGLITSAAGRLVMVALALSGSVTVLAFRAIRPDTTMFFVCALVFFVSALPRDFRSRCWLAGLASVLLPLAGLQMLPYVGTLLVLHLLWFGRAEAGLLVAVGAGCAAGLGLLVAIYEHFSRFTTFKDIVFPFTGLAKFQGGHWAEKLVATPDPALFQGDTIFNCFFGRPFEMLRASMFDFSAFFLFLILLAGAGASWRRADRATRRKLLFLFSIVLLVPPALFIAGHYRFMYRWMTYLPLALGVPWLLTSPLPANRSKIFRGFAAGLLVLAIAMGLPARTANAFQDWPARATAPLDQAVAAIIRPDDVVICHFKAWFAVRPKARLVYCAELPARGALERAVNLPTNSVSLLCLYPENCDRVMRIIGGEWEKIPLTGRPEFAAYRQSRYCMDFYRRKGQMEAARTP